MVTSKCEACSYNATNLIKGNEYQFRISAVNKFGAGKPLDSDPVIAQMQYSKYLTYCLRYWPNFKSCCSLRKLTI